LSKKHNLKTRNLLNTSNNGMERHGSYWKIPDIRKVSQNHELDNSYYINSNVIEEAKNEDGSKTGKF
jgi:hypothetical protein